MRLQHLLATLILCSFLPCRAAALDPGYFAKAWGAEDGLPQHVVTSVLQTRAGDLWCSTYNGLARFDGARFTVFDQHSLPPLPGRGVTVIYEDRRGTLWAGFENGAVHSFQDNQPASRQERSRSGSGQVKAIAEDAAGALWALRLDGSAERMHDGLFLRADPGIDLSDAQLDLVQDGDQRLWLVHRSGLVEVTETGLRPANTGLSASADTIQRTARAAAGGLWVVADGRLRRWQKDGWVGDAGPLEWPENMPGRDSVFVTALLELRDGRLFYGTTNNGAALGRPGQPLQIYDRRQGIPHSWVRCLAEDREGNLWLGGGGGGLVALRPRRVAMVPVTDDDTLLTVQSLFPEGDKLWAATEGGGLYLLDGDQRQRFRESEGLSYGYLWCVSSGPESTLWTGSWRGDLYVRKPSGGFNPAPGWPEQSLPVKILLHARDDSLWAGGGRAMARLMDGRWHWTDPQGRLWAPEDQQSITEDQAGGIWIGMTNGEILHRMGPELKVLTQFDGLPGDAVVTLYAESPETLWAGTAGGGLVRLRQGKALALTTRHGLPGRIISQLLPDGHGHLWAGTYQGIARLSLRDLHACADGTLDRLEPLLLQRSDGMASLECTNAGQPGACATPDGRLWFPTSRGLAVIDPASIIPNPVPPPVRVEGLILDGAEVPLPSASPVFGPGVEQVTLDYTALSFTAPERVRFRTRLEGLEDSWQDAGTERRATYRYLPPGRYSFQVMACNNDGLWNPEPATLEFTLRPLWWQRPALRALGAALSAFLLGGVIWGMARRRNATRLERLERSHALERERARIARDIHDDLGSGLTRIMLLSESARSELPDSSPAAAEVDAIRSAADTLTRDMDEIVWAIDPRHDSLESLVSYAGSAAQEYLKTAGLRFRLEAPDHLPPWPLSAECRHSLFLAFREALTNVVRHAGARTVRVIFTVHSSAFTLTVEDDGAGFDPARPGSRPGGGRGLANMRDRLAELHGGCTVTSCPGGPTRVSFRIPVAGIPVS